MRNLFLCAIFIFLVQISISQTCIGESGRSVDWWVVLKTTKNVAYGYFDSEMQARSSVFKVNDKPFSNPNGAVSRTLVQINNLQNMEATAWSDQPPNGNAGNTFAHAKGLIAFSRTSRRGFAIEHSLPQYPEFADDNSINPVNKNNSNVYGQTLFCQSLSIQQLDDVAEKFRAVKPYVYFSSIRITGGSDTKQLEALSQNSKISKPASPINYIDYRVGSTQIKGVFKAAGFKYSIFGDHAKDVIGLPRLLNSSIYVETWRGDNGDFCNPNSRWDDNVMYINQIKLGSYRWRRTADHSKWVVSTNGEWSCIGGMNRQKSQWSRGGEFFCVKSRNLNRAFSSIIYDKSSCKENESSFRIVAPGGPKLVRRNTIGHQESE